MYNDQAAPVQLTLEDINLLAGVKRLLAAMSSKVTDEDVWNCSQFVAAAQLYVSTYQGDFDFMLSLRNDAAIHGFGRWTAGKYRGALNCLRAEALREARAAEETKAVAEGRDPEGTMKVERTIPLGTYTAVFADGSHQTFRVKKHWEADKAERGEKVLQYMSGPDNESSFTGFAFLVGTQVKVWGKFKAQVTREGRLFQGLKIIFQDPAKAGEAYALESSHCFRCGRKLTVPVSIHRGLGPECAQKWG